MLGEGPTQTQLAAGLLQLLKKAVAEAKSRVRHVVGEEPDVKAKKKGLEQAIKGISITPAS